MPMFARTMRVVIGGVLGSVIVMVLGRIVMRREYLDVARKRIGEMGMMVGVV